MANFGWPHFVDINVTVENQGTSNETFNLTVYADSLTIQTMTITDLAPGLSETLSFRWELHLFTVQWIFPPPWPPDEPMLENLTIWAEAEGVAGEVDTSDNVYIDGIVTVIWWVLDVDGDGKINIIDLALVALAFGSYEEDPEYDPWLDFNQDGKINIEDLAFSGSFFGVNYA